MEQDNDRGNDRGMNTGSGAGIGGNNIWILIPLTALMIPILAVSGSVTGGWFIPYAVGVGLVILIGAIVAQMLMTHSHRLRMNELGERHRLAQLESANLEQTNQVMRQNRLRRETSDELRSAVSSRDGLAETSLTQPLTDG